MTTATQQTSLEIEEKFDPHLISGLYRNFKNASSAILEIIDNAIDDMLFGRQLIITVSVHGNKITIVNKGGSGMGLSELEGFFVWGLSKKRGKLGRYGQGGKAAMGYLGKSWQIITTKKGESDEYLIEEDNWDDRSVGMKRYTPKVSPSIFEDGVVQIDIWNLKKKISKNEITEELSNVYSPLIESGEVVIIVNSKRIQPKTIICEYPKDHFSFEVGENKKVSGWLSILESGTSMRGGVRCYEFGRLIYEKEFFGPKDPSYKESLDRLIGELNIEFELPLLMNKTDFDRDSEEWKMIQKEMQKLLEPYIQLLLKEKEKDLPSEKEKKSIEYANSIWPEFLKYLQYHQKEGSLPGLSIDHGQKPREQSVDTNESTEIEKEELDENNLRKDYNPKTPPPIDKVGIRRRTGAYLRAVPRSLPEYLRYKTGKENEEEVLWINTRFSNYKLRMNQLPLYTWETQIIEYAKSEDEDQTVEEYINEMNNMVSNLCKFIRAKNIKFTSSL